MNCFFCYFGAAPFGLVPALFVVDGISVCEEHVDAVSGQGSGPDLRAFQMRNL